MHGGVSLAGSPWAKEKDQERELTSGERRTIPRWRGKALQAYLSQSEIQGTLLKFYVITLGAEDWSRTQKWGLHAFSKCFFDHYRRLPCG